MLPQTLLLDPPPSTYITCILSSSQLLTIQFEAQRLVTLSGFHPDSDGFHQLAGRACGSAVHQENAGAARLRKDVRLTRNSNDEDIVRKALRFRVNRRLRGNTVRHCAEQETCSSADRGFEQLSAGRVLIEHGSATSLGVLDARIYPCGALLSAENRPFFENPD